jgi:hypothetical protein
LALALTLGGCQSPFLVFAGGELGAVESSADSFAFADDYTLLKLEVRPEQPYSVILRVTVIDGALYIDAAERRRWHTYLQANPKVRVQLGDAVYPAQAVPVSDPAITGRFLSGRIVYRIDPSIR